MKKAAEKSLKAQNMKWLVSLATLDVAVVLFCLVPELLGATSRIDVATGRFFAAATIPVIVLLLSGILPSNVKSMLVYWRGIGWLPGRQAFSKYGPADARVDMAALRKNIGVLPTDPDEQNTRWFKLYKMLPDEISVVEAHRAFLMYRDMAAMSVLLAVLAPIGLISADTNPITVGIGAGVFIVQYLAAALSARWSGVRLVENVLAIHSTRKVQVPEPKQVKKS